MTSEKDNYSSPEQGFNTEKLESIGHEQRERLQRDLERSVETSAHERLENARHEALEQASKTERGREKDRKEDATATKAETIHKNASKRDKERSFNKTMREVQSQMSGPSRTFSRIIHNPAVERASEVAGSTVARPNAILSGAVFSFVLTLAVYLVARFNGYPLSGSETIAAFILGWLVGVGYDFLRAMITGKR